MADRWWVNGSGTWDNSSTTHWSAAAPVNLPTTSCSGTTLTTTGSPALAIGMTVISTNNVSLGTITGGSVNTWTVTIGGTYASQQMAGFTFGASAPTSSDSVFFIQASSCTSFTVTMGEGAASPSCLNFTHNPASEATTFSAGATVSWNVYGSFTCSADITFTAVEDANINFLATTTGKTISTNYVTLGIFRVNFNSTTGGWTLGSAFQSARSITFLGGTFNTGNFDMEVGAMISSGTSTRVITLGTSIITLGVGGSLTPWQFGTTTGSTLSAASSTLRFSGSDITFQGGGLTYGSVSFITTGFNTHLISGTNTFTNLTFANKSTTVQSQLAFYANQTVTGTLTLGSPNVAGRRFFVRSDTLGTQRTLTVGTCAAMSDIDFRDIVAAGASSPWSGTRIGDCKNNSGITFTAAKTVYLSSVSGANTNWNATCWANTTGGTPDAFNFPLPQDTAIIDNSGATTGNGLRTGFTLTLDDNWNLGTVTSTRTSAYNLSQGAQDPQIYGNLTLSSGITFVGTTTPSLTFHGQNSTQTITSNGKTILQNAITVNSPGGTVRLLDALTQSFSATSTSATFTLTSGTLDLNGFTLTAVAFNSSGSAVRTLAYGSTGKIVTTGGAGASQTVFTVSTSTNLTVTGSANVECFLTSGYSNTLTIRSVSGGGTLPESNAINFYITGGGVDQVSIANVIVIKDFSTVGHGVGGILFLGSSTTSYGNLTLGTGTTFVTSNPASAITFASTSGTKTITTNGVAINKALTFNGVGGTWQLANDLVSNTTSAGITLTAGTLNLNSKNLTTRSITTSGSSTRALAFGASGKIILTGNNSTIFNSDTATGLTVSGSANIESDYTGSTGTRTVNMGNTAGGSINNACNIKFTGGSDIITLYKHIGDIDFTGFTGTLSATGTKTIYGNLTFSSAMSFTTATENYNFASTSGTKTITTNGISIDAPVTFDGVGGAWSLTDLTADPTFLKNVSLNTGTLNFEYVNVYGNFYSNTNNTRALNGSRIYFQSNNAIFDISGSNYSTNGLIGLWAFANNVTINGGNNTYDLIYSPGQVNITGNNSFRFISTAVNTGVIVFPAGGTTTIRGTDSQPGDIAYNSGIAAVGEGNQAILRSSIPGTTAIIYSEARINTLTGQNFDEILIKNTRIKDISATGNTVWYAGPDQSAGLAVGYDSISDGNVSGITFTRGNFLHMF